VLEPHKLVPMIFGMLLLTAPRAGLADEDRFEIGVQANVFSAGGEPANDIIGGGIFGTYKLNEDWYVGVGIDLASYDFEDPAKILGIPTADSIDASADSTAVTAWIERAAHSIS